MKRVGFRTRLLLVLALFAVVPSAILTAVFSWSVDSTMREVRGTDPWEEIAQTGLAALEVAERNAASDADRKAINEHRTALSRSLTNANRLEVYAQYSSGATVILAVFAFLLLGVATVRVAGHLSRQLSRPLHELVGWTEMMARGDKLPDASSQRGAPEFEMLRQRMKLAERELRRSRERVVEAERLRAFRETARQVAHELKNVLTPVRFAVSRLQRDATLAQGETLAVLDIETRRLEDIARSFSLFGKLPEGPLSDIDVAELVTYTAMTTVHDATRLTLDVDAELPLLKGHHDALARALANVILNAVDASQERGAITVTARRSSTNPSWIELQVADEGHGMDSEKLATIWEPYVTYKAGGTGLGLAITKQTVEAHGGRVEARSTPGRGTVITFLLPLSNGARSAAFAASNELS
jgi:signal transduction histidine kinase